MPVNPFMTFDPFLSFSERGPGFKKETFLTADGRPANEWLGGTKREDGYLCSLWRVGREAYATLANKYDEEPDTSFLKESLIAIDELEQSLLPRLQELANDGVLVLRQSGESVSTNNVARTLEQAERGFVAHIFTRFLRPLAAAGDIAEDAVADFEALFLIVAISYIDDCIIADQIGHDMSAALELVMSNVASAELYRETIDAAKAAVSAAGRRSARARHLPTNQLKAAALADWAAEGHNFSSMRAFARECFKRYEVKDFTTVYNWLREHRKNKP